MFLYVHRSTYVVMSGYKLSDHHSYIIISRFEIVLIFDDISTYVYI